MWPQTIVQACVVHLIRNSFRYASRLDWPELARDPPGHPHQGRPRRPLWSALADFAGTWEAKYPVIVKMWESSTAEFVPFLSFAPDVRQVIYTTDAIESVNARITVGRSRLGSFGERAKGAQVCVPGRDEFGSDRERPSAQRVARAVRGDRALPGVPRRQGGRLFPRCRRFWDRAPSPSTSASPGLTA